MKLHPDYQGVNADDEKFISLVKRATETGFYVMVHSGHDTGILPPFKGTVDKISTLLNRIIESHGVDRILFGSDSPWESPKDTYEFLIKSGICGDDLEKITHINAEKILGIKN